MGGRPINAGACVNKTGATATVCPKAYAVWCASSLGPIAEEIEQRLILKRWENRRDVTSSMPGAATARWPVPRPRRARR